jgi:EAL domain-containing protein (putative c-di-GMP-specific phosphodiesterase class I)
VERPEQADALRALGCRFGQGYLFARPLAPADVDDLLRRGTGVVSSDGAPSAGGPVSTPA